jgi:hypothetical protein
MVAIPTTKDEDAKRPNRERESFIGEQTRIVNRMKVALIRLGIPTVASCSKLSRYGLANGEACRKVGATANLEPAEECCPLIPHSPDVPISRIKCGAPHFMRNVAPVEMWRSARNVAAQAGDGFLKAT